MDKRTSRATAPALTRGSNIDRKLKAYHVGGDIQLDGDPVESAMMAGYHIRWKDSGLNVVAHDTQFYNDLSEGEHGPVRARMVGELDAVAEDQNGTRVVLEFKTTSEDISPGSAYWKRILQVDPQATTYLMAAKKLGITQIVWDVLRKPELRLKKNETQTGFYERICEDIASRPEHYYQRATVVRLDTDREEFIRDVTGYVHLIQECQRTGNTPRNPDSCMKWNRECEFLGVCSGNLEITNDEYFKHNDYADKYANVGADDPIGNAPPTPSNGGVRQTQDRQIVAPRGDAQADRYRF